MNFISRNTGHRKLSAPALSLLGGISADVFLREYWQKKPLLIRGAISDFSGPLSKKEVLALACRDDAESRLIAREGSSWQFDRGPFSKRDLQHPKNVRWTVLVQDVQHFSHEAHELLARFNFIPQARIDDLMVSYAVEGAGVGAHFDTYDVFLLQGMGRRRWQISQQQDLRLKPGLPLKVLAHFRPEEEFVLETGDMLYLPPSVAHNGIAETECMTWSIGFRAPSKQELTVAFLDYLRDSLQLPGQYTDPDLEPTRHAAKVDAATRKRFGNLLREVQDAARDTAAIREFTGCYLTEPKPHVIFERPETPLTPAQFRRQSVRHGLQLELKARILYDDEHVYINGEAIVPAKDAWPALRHLANNRALSSASFARIESETVLAFLFECFCNGAISIAHHQRPA